jgi:cobalt-zinc-cadmium efflux system protein
MTREQKLLFILVFNLALMALEITGGILSNSLALLSDAGHMLTDSFAVFMSLMAVYIAKKPSNPSRSFGYHRAEIIATLVNGILLTFMSGYIFYEAFHRFLYPVEVKTGILITIALIGLIGNIAGMLILKTESESNLNIRGVFLHIMSDTLSSVGVIGGGIIIAFTGLNLIDPLIGLLIGGVVLRSGFGLIIESSEVLLEAAPRDINPEEVKTALETIPGVKEFHEMHIWTITSGKRALSGHILMDNITTRQGQEIVASARKLLTEKFNIGHSTLEVECDSCQNNGCEFNCAVEPDIK